METVVIVIIHMLTARFSVLSIIINQIIDQLIICLNFNLVKKSKIAERN